MFPFENNPWKGNEVWSCEAQAERYKFALPQKARKSKTDGTSLCQIYHFTGNYDHYKGYGTFSVRDPIATIEYANRIANVASTQVI